MPILCDTGADEYGAGDATWTAPITVVVDSINGNDGNDGLTWETAKLTVQAAANLAAASGGDVLVKEGTYNERVTLRSHVHLYGGYHETGQGMVRDPRIYETAIDGDVSPAGSAVTVYAGHLMSTLDGFTVTGGVASLGGGVYCYPAESPTIANNTITGNSATTYGGGIYCASSSYAQILFNAVVSNASTGVGLSKGGGGICCNTSNATVASNIISGNSSGSYGGGVLISGTGTPKITNNTIVGNSCGVGAGIYVASGTPVIANNIVASNTGSPGNGIQYATGTPTLVHNDVYGNSGSGYVNCTGDAYSIALDPLFATGTFSLTEDSPCIDAGDDTKVLAGWLDIDGEPRQVDVPDKGTANTKVDIGADEYYLDYANEPLVDEGLPTENVNGSGQARTNFRWANPSTMGACGDIFSFASWPGPAWRIDKIVVWVVPDVPVWPTYALGDHFSSISLYGGSVGGAFDDIVTGTLQTGSNTISAPAGMSIVAGADQYTIGQNTYDYEAADGQWNKIWKITFDISSLNWTVTDGTQGVFGVYGAPRYDRLWFSHATMTTAPSADILLFNAVNATLDTWTDPKEWFGGKRTDINVRVYATPVLP